VRGQPDSASEGVRNPWYMGVTSYLTRIPSRKAPLESFKRKHIDVLLLNIRGIGSNEVGTTCVFGD
jgi:hypothetical protein